MKIIYIRLFSNKMIWARTSLNPKLQFKTVTFSEGNFSVEVPPYWVDASQPIVLTRAGWAGRKRSGIYSCPAVPQLFCGRVTTEEIAFGQA